MEDKEYTTNIEIRHKEPWFKDILTCLLESLFFVKSSGDTIVEEKDFHGKFTYPKIRNDPAVDEKIKSILVNELSTDKNFGIKNDTLSFYIEFSNGSNYERWRFNFKMKKEITEDGATESLKKALTYISETVLGHEYCPPAELQEPKIGHSIKYNVKIEQTNFRQNGFVGWLFSKA